MTELAATNDARAVPGAGTAWLTTWPLDGRRWELDRPALTIGRAATADVTLVDALVSRVHARLERVAGTWTVVDDGLSRNGTWLNGRRLDGRHALHDGDQIRVGRTVLVLHHPDDDGPSTEVAEALPSRATLTAAQLAVVEALCRPYASDGVAAAPATNAQIAAELFLSVETVKTHLRAVCLRLGIEHLPGHQKRLRLVELAVRSGLVQLHELRSR